MKVNSFYGRKIAVLVFASLLILSSCGKEKRRYQTSVSGYVKERNGTRVIEGAHVYLMDRTSDGSFGSGPGGPGRVRDSATTGPDGFYSFDFNFGDGDFIIIGDANNYYELHHSKAEYLKVGEDQVHNVELWPHAWLRVRFINQSGADGVDVNPFYGEPFGYSIFGQKEATVVGQVKGNSDNKINYFVFPGSKPQNSTVFCKGLDTTYHEITY